MSEQIRVSVAVIGGGSWSALGLPLGWLLGAAIAIGIWAGLGLPARAPRPIQRAGLMVVGASVGLWVTPEVARQLVGWLPMMLASAALGVTLAILCTPLFARLAGLDKATAYAAEDADITLRLHQVLRPKLAQTISKLLMPKLPDLLLKIVPQHSYLL